MIKKNLKVIILSSVAILLPMLAGLALWSKLPNEIPIHWNASGEVDGWSTKAFAVFVFPLILLALHLMTVLLTSADPKKQNHSQKALVLAFWVVPAISIIMSGIVYATAMGMELIVNVIVPVTLGLLFVIIGNYLPKCKQNYTIGIKIAWTLNSEENWNKTHRLAGWVWVVCGFAIMITGCFGWIIAILPISLIMVAVPIIYSYVLYRKGV